MKKYFAPALALLSAVPAMAQDAAIDSLGSMASGTITQTKGPLLMVFGTVLGVTVLFFAYRKIKGAAGGR